MNTSSLEKWAETYKHDVNNVESVQDKEKLKQMIESLENDAHHQWIYNLIDEHYHNYIKKVKRLQTKNLIPYKGKLEPNKTDNKTENITFDIYKLPVDLLNMIYNMVVECKNLKY